MTSAWIGGGDKNFQQIDVAARVDQIMFFRGSLLREKDYVRETPERREV